MIFIKMVAELLLLKWLFELLKLKIPVENIIIQMIVENTIKISFNSCKEATIIKPIFCLILHSSLKFLYLGEPNFPYL